MINFKPVEGFRNFVRLIDQTQLPEEEIYIQITTLEQMEDAIKRLVVRGAPAIGIAAAYGLVVHINPFKEKIGIIKEFNKAFEVLKSTRPTAVNLFWALERMKKYFQKLIETESNLETIKEKLFQEAVKIEEEDYQMCLEIGEHAYSLMKDKSEINAMTICNAGGLATSGLGTALSGFYLAHDRGKKIEVFPLETRPLLQGSRLTAYELLKSGIKTTLLTDNMAGALMKSKKIDLIIAGADRIALNGDSANKIGTYQLAVLASYHKIPFYIAAPVSTFDFNIKTGNEIPIEFRSRDEVIFFNSKTQTAPLNVDVFSPAFDVTPASLITGIITNKGIFYPPYNFKTLK
ncbi:MAG TPA: S-methyl-5-thioribose-1-phosphate isomerase [Spirochaetia bacterium]|nr:MAG: S-methyl-5-thioribose-1-phosphate isomerase [Spirochaetes bacterium GWB1_36_13]HCL55896.1 S-methyl-5-thioribose-1-phosphate isomerase [Spirochaetia bacterium]